MPCWYYEKKDLRLTPSFKNGINPDVEARYRREGARFIIDSGTKMGLRYDTCATGVVYFHRFYMFHSFREFHRYVTAACCLFLAGKVEETPKKCKDIIKVTRSMLTEAQFQVFGEDPREEVMTMERILLQTIKFDLMVEHPYAYLMKFAKLIKGDKDKTQKLVQMAWTFVNDSLCTSLCLQWEPDIIAISLMYLASRLTKVDITDWVGKVSGQKVKWYEGLVEDATLEILEEVCHQVLDLYSTTPQASKEESPPPPPPPPKPTVSPVPSKTPTKRSRSPSPSKPSKTSRQASPTQQHRSQSPTYQDPAPTVGQTVKQPPPTAAAVPAAAAPIVPTAAAAAQMVPPKSTYEQTNPYVSSNMYSSSFLSGEGSNAIQTLIGTRQPAPVATTAPQYSAAQPTAQGRIPVTYTNTAYPPPSVNYQYQQATQAARVAPSANPYSQTTGQYAGQHAQQKQQQQYSQYSSYSQQQGGAGGYHYTASSQQSVSVGSLSVNQGSMSTVQGQAYQSYTQQQQQGYSSGGGGGQQQGYGAVVGQYGGGTGNRGHQQQGQARSRTGSSNALAPVRITGRQQRR